MGVMVLRVGVICHEPIAKGEETKENDKHLGHRGEEEMSVR